jgi:hypothetical protein
MKTLEVKTREGLVSHKRASSRVYSLTRERLVSLFSVFLNTVLSTSTALQKRDTRSSVVETLEAVWYRH